MALNTEYLERCILTLESALERLSDHETGEVAYDIYRSACVKQFELILEQSGKLLRKKISAWSASNRVGSSIDLQRRVPDGSATRRCWKRTSANAGSNTGTAETIRRTNPAKGSPNPLFGSSRNSSWMRSP